MGTILDILLTLITLVVAIIGTLLRDPSRNVKTFLIALAVCASLASVAKAFMDKVDKDFLKSAVISGLNPSAAVYQDLISETAAQAKEFGFDHYDCYHKDGMACFFSSTQHKDQHATLVLSSLAVSEMYGNKLEHKSNRQLIKAEWMKIYNPADLSEDFKDRVGILGSAVFADMYGNTWPEYGYSDRLGVTHVVEVNGTRKEIVIAPSELVSKNAAKACDLFYALGERFREKYQADVGTPVIQ